MSDRVSGTGQRRRSNGIRSTPRGEETRRTILLAAQAVFAERGFAGARMDDVAERVGIRRASLVHHFPDKQALYVAALGELFDGLLEGYRDALAGPGPLPERVLRCLDVWAARVEARPALLPISLWEMARATPAEAVPLATLVQPIVTVLADAVRLGQWEGVFRDDVDPVGLIMSVAGTTAFLGLRTNLLGPSIAAPMAPGALRKELRTWFARSLFLTPPP